MVSATDLVGYLSCPHYTTLSLAALATGGAKPAADGSSEETSDLDVLQRRGDEHEQKYLAQLHADGLTVVEVAACDTLAEQERHTVDAIASGADIIFQATFFDTTEPDAVWRGHADFLRRVDDHGSFSYEPEDTKLARHVKPSALVQLCMYAEQLERLQGRAPERIHVVLGGQESVPFITRDLSAYYRRAKQRFLDAATAPHGDTYPTPVEHCTVCRHREVCTERRSADDHLSLVARLTGEQVRKLTDAGVTTVAELASTGSDFVVAKMGGHTLERLRRQARLQVEARTHPDSPLPVERLPSTGPGSGFEGLPEPNDGDLYFDIEGDPYVGDGGLEYLLGVGWVVEGQFEFTAFWAHTPAGEKAAFEKFIDFVVERRRRHPGLHVYHYAPYEPSALGKLSGRHATRETEVDELLRGRVLVDLYRVVSQSIAVGSPSYSIKKLEPLYMPPRDAAITDAGSSIVEYERWLQTGDQQILDDIEEYNRDDCESTWRLRDWLEQQRSSAEADLGVTLARPTATTVDEPDEPAAEQAAEIAELVARLTEGIDVAPDPDDHERYARWLLAQLIDWHRREAKPEWWMYFQRLEASDEDLFNDTEAIAGLEYAGEVGLVKKSMVYRYRFDPDQEHKLKVGTDPVDPATARVALERGDKRVSPGIIAALDLTAGTIDLKRGLRSTAPHPGALIPGDPVRPRPLDESLRSVAAHVIATGIDGDGPNRAIRDLLMRRPPRITGIEPGQPLVDPSAEADTVEIATQLALGLDHSYLPIQGPPGCGKTYTAARMILRLVAAGHRVGITANSHSVITNLIREIHSAATADPTVVPPRIVQKCDLDKAATDTPTTVVGKSEQVEAALAGGQVDIVAGTSWLFARSALAGTLDDLLIDEAGQLSLANVVAVSPAATNLILVGDPQQLAQPSKGNHPAGAEQSGLEYVLNGHETVPVDQGLFLGSTYRMHPAVCSFISELAYETRLHSVPGRELQTVAAGPLVSGAGIRWRPVEHQGNRTSSVEEAELVAELYDALIGRNWTNVDGVTGAITATDILVVAPYNAQVHLLSERLGRRARVGTVDKLQGQEGAVVIVSMTASSAEDVPRGMEFLFSRNRLNVAVSRARAMSIVVGSPTLLSARCRTPEQMMLVNGLCRYVELADQQEPHRQEPHRQEPE